MNTCLGGIDIDWEEQLSRLSGDVLAHRLGTMVRGALDWGRRAKQSLERDVAEYLREETGLNPRQDEVESFVAGVDVLREAVDRLEARLERLARNTEH